MRLLGPALLSEHEELYKQAGWLMASLAVDPLCAKYVVEQGGLQLLVHYAKKEHEGYQEEAAWALANLSSSAENASALAQAGALAPLLQLSRSGASVKTQALWAIANLAVNEEIKELLGEVR